MMNLLALALVIGSTAATDTVVIRYNQLGYLPDAPKVAVACALGSASIERFTVRDEGGRIVLGPVRARAQAGFGPCARTWRLDVSELRDVGRYTIVADGATPVSFEVRTALEGVADIPLYYLRQQRSRFNPFFGDSVHHRTDALLVDHPDEGAYLDVAGGWADAADYLQYVTTSANATFLLLQAARDHAPAFGDGFDANGLPGANGLPDVLDEARWGLEWLLRMFPEDDLLLNQIGDDRDHMHLDLPTTDSSNYGWGHGGYRPVYPCTGRPQGLINAQNRSDGKASTAGKMASAFALGAQLFAEHDAAFADSLAQRAVAAYGVGREHPGVCQTAPGRAPYFYEEANWVDDMELAAASLHALTGDTTYLRHALEYAADEPVTPWMGADTARHYEFYPWHNNGHYEAWRTANDADRQTLIDYYRRGLDAVVARADHGFRIGVPFIWCSSNLIASFATQALHYRTMTGDDRYREYEAAAFDWLFGTNPWGTSLVIGLPANGTAPRDPHSVVAERYGWQSQLGGLVDGPVYRSIFENLQYVTLRDADEFAAFNTGHIVYHDDWGDYSTNEPIMDGTANLVYLLGAYGY